MPEELKDQQDASQQDQQVADNTQQQDQSNADFLEMQGVKVPLTEFEKLAREKYKDAFDSFDNQKSWKAELAERGRELNELKRKAESFDRLEADRLNQSRSNPPASGLDKLREQFIDENLQFYPEADPNAARKYLSSQFDWQLKLAGHKTQEALQPIYEQDGERVEREFLQAHTDVVKGSPEYLKIADKYSKGYELEDAYYLVMKPKIDKQKTDEAIKASEEDAKRKLQQNRQSSSNASVEHKPKSNSDRIRWAMEQHGMSYP